MEMHGYIYFKRSEILYQPIFLKTSLLEV